MLENMFLNTDVLGVALQGSAYKNDVIQNNIANADTPNFKKQEVSFENSLIDEINSATIDGAINLDNVKATVSTDPNSVRLDGNDVDLNVEMVEMYKNSVRYDTLAQSVINDYKRINLAFGGSQ